MQNKKVGSKDDTRKWYVKRVSDRKGDMIAKLATKLVNALHSNKTTALVVTFLSKQKHLHFNQAQIIHLSSVLYKLILNF